MTVSELAANVSAQDWAQGIAGSWLFPFLETIHVFALVAVLGSIAIVDWRLIGFTKPDHSVTALTRQALPWTWAGFAVSVVTGVLMLVGQAPEYITNPAFQSKMVLVGLAGLNLLAFHLIPWRTVRAWDQQSMPPAPARVAGALSLSFWIGVVACGRWIAFTHGN